MGLLQTISGVLKDAFKEHHHPLNPAPEVMEKLKDKGYSFEFNMIVAGVRGPAIKLWTVITPDGTRIKSRISDKNREAGEKYKTDYEEAVRECNPAP